MNVTWINDARCRFDGAYMSMRGTRTPAGTVRLCLYFSARAAERLGLERGERLLVGLDDDEQRLAFRPTMFGGNALKGSDKHGALECYVTLPIENLPEAQFVRESDLVELSDCMAVPFTFDAAQFRGWKGKPALRAAA